MKIHYTESFKKDVIRLFSRNPIYLIPRVFNDLYYRAKWGCQRMFRGYDDVTCWNYNTEIANISIAALTEIKKNLHGHPGQCKDIKEWKTILTKLIQGFKAYKHLSELDYIRKTNKTYKTGNKKGRHIYYIDNRAKTKWEIDFDKGMTLYKKYFFALWD